MTHTAGYSAVMTRVASMPFIWDMLRSIRLTRPADLSRCALPATHSFAPVWEVVGPPRAAQCPSTLARISRSAAIPWGLAMAPWNPYRSGFVMTGSSE